jgi:hypothetical protein
MRITTEGFSLKQKSVLSELSTRASLQADFLATTSNPREVAVTTEASLALETSPFSKEEPEGLQETAEEKATKQKTDRTMRISTTYFPVEQFLKRLSVYFP